MLVIIFSSGSLHGCVKNDHRGIRRKSVIPCELECRLKASPNESRFPRLPLRLLVALPPPLVWPLDDFLPDALEADSDRYIGFISLP